MLRLRTYLFAASIFTLGPLHAQLIPWSEPPEPARLSEVASRRERPARQDPAITAKPKPAAVLETETALQLPPSTVDGGWFLLQAIPTTLLVSSFTSTDVGSERANTTWVGQVTQNAGTITVAGTAANDNGWGASGVSLNTTGMNSLFITAQRDSGNLAPTLFIQFEDLTLRTKVLSVSTSLFAVGSMTTVQIPLSGWTVDFGGGNVTGWSIGGGNVGDTAFRLTFDEIFFSTASAIPEPATSAAFAGLLALIAIRHRRQRAGR